ncbi:uracil-DNA glycosylase family protein [Thalassotalea sp. M1531]|uniref:Uracil-DNA glycosylase family protein n=1 Tax=Thalassotalea algicola TaxID=2716224 RepID=A0A7Y0LB25_9GAMM|nr:uracil-DNA glycosylase family protein [Thalassotalea algicola]NMP31273.1 uracil-DNA glycosylase family protein [Thalassotalea algicola]
MTSLKQLLSQISQCQLCKNQLPLAPRPILQCNVNSKILIAGQAPGVVTHEKLRPFDDKSGERLRTWLGVDKTIFYNEELLAIVPMGFCYPGKGKSGDLPPIPLCEKTWRAPLLAKLPQIELTILVGKYAIDWHLANLAGESPLLKYKNITDVVKHYQVLLQQHTIALPHPSPRNNLWLKKNPWFEQDVIPLLQQRVASILTK